MELEWTGLGDPLEGIGTGGVNATSIDTFLVAETASSRRRAYLMEWKHIGNISPPGPTSRA